MTLSYTARLKLAVPDFLTEPWHSEFAASMDSIDQIVYNALIAEGATLWLNSTAYIVGDIVINPDNGNIYTCAVAHTSTATPQTFTQEVIDHPTYWTSIAPSPATQAEAETGVENTKYMTPLRTAQAMAALSSATSPYVPHCGRLTMTSATQLKFSPYNGNVIKINGILYDIPTAGIAGLANTSVRVSGVAGQNLAANTTYTVFAIIVSGVLTAEYRLASSYTHRPSQAVGNEGVEVMLDPVGPTEAPSYTLIGIIRTNASSQFEDDQFSRHVRTWFNRGASPLHTWLSSSQATVSNTYVEIMSSLRLEWVNFTNETAHLHFNGMFYSTGGVAATMEASLGLDSGTVAQNAWAYHNSVADQRVAAMPVHLIVTPSEGFHFATPLYRATGGISITSFSAANTNGNRPTFSGLIIPGEGSSDVTQ